MLRENKQGISTMIYNMLGRILMECISIGEIYPRHIGKVSQINFEIRDEGRKI